jgi:hypothetical protein
VFDCAGVWGGDAIVETFYLDTDGDGLGSGAGYELCNGLDLTGWVTNNDDVDDDCYSNLHDCALCLRWFFWVIRLRFCVDICCCVFGV